MDPLSDAQLDRFARQILVSAIGYDGQVRILSSRVTVGGDGPAVDLAARYLKAAGISVDASARTQDTGTVEVRCGERVWRRTFPPGDGFAMMVAVGYLGIEVLVHLAQPTRDGEA